MAVRQSAEQSGKGKALTIAQKAITINAFLNKDENKIKMRTALPKHITPEKLISVVMNSIRRNPRIAECTLISVFDCVMTSAQLGIPPDDIRGLAYIIPFNNRRKGVMEAQLMPGYKGFIHLAKESGEVINIWSRVVYQGEAFSVEEGLNPHLTHTPMEPSKRGKPIGAYTCVVLKSGIKGFTFMWEEEIQKIKGRSKAKDDGPWLTDPDEMRKKTTIRRDMKLRDLSPRMNQAVALDEMMDTDKSIRNEEFGVDEFMTESLPGKTDVKIPKAKDEPQDAEITEEFKPSNDDENRLYSSIVDLTIAMRWSDNKTRDVETRIKRDGLEVAHTYVRREYEQWEIAKSTGTTKGTTSAYGTDMK